jgi:hypothetical protein
MVVALAGRVRQRQMIMTSTIADADHHRRP